MVITKSGGLVEITPGGGGSRPLLFDHPGASVTNRVLDQIFFTSRALQVTGHAADDLTQPGMCRLIVQPPQPDHGSFDRFRGT